MELIALVVIGLFAAGVLKGATGIGYTSCALPFVAAALGLQSAIALLVIPAMASNVMVALTAGNSATTIRRFWPLYLATLPGVAVGATLLAWVDPRLATRVLGLVIIAYVAHTTLQPNLSLSDRLAHQLQIPIGLTNGLLTGLTGSQVMPLMPYMFALRLEPAAFVQAVNLAVITGATFLGVSLLLNGSMSAQMLALSGLSVVPAMLGVRLGNWARGRIPSRRFKSAVLAVLFVMGSALLLRS